MPVLTTSLRQLRVRAHTHTHTQNIRLSKSQKHEHCPNPQNDQRLLAGPYALASSPITPLASFPSLYLISCFKTPNLRLISSVPDSMESWAKSQPYNLYTNSSPITLSNILTKHLTPSQYVCSLLQSAINPTC